MKFQKINETASVLFLVTALFTFYFFTPSETNNPKKTEESLETSGAMEALNFWNRSRAYPNNDIPSGKYYKAYQNEKKTNNVISGLDSVPPWKAMGPLNVPGRTISLAVNPQNSSTLFAGAATGGLWRTYNSSAGGGWQRVVTGFPTHGVMAIAIDPTDSLNMYIGTGEVYGYNQSLGGYVIRTTRGSYGIGILKSTDGGATWNKSLDWTFQEQRGIEALRINPLNSNTIYAATSIGIYKSIDAGNSWVNVLDKFMGEDIVINSSDTNKVIVSCGNLGSAGSGIYRTLDAGLTWTKLSGIPDFTGKTLLDIYGADPNVVFASVADSLSGIGLYRTDDFGDTWTLVNSQDVPQYQGFFAHWVAVNPSDKNQVIHAGVQITKSTNGGTTLNTVYGTHVDHHNFAHDPNNPNIIYISNDGGVYRSTNFGSSYQNIGYGMQTSQFYNGFSSSYSDSSLALGGLQDNNTAVYKGSPDWDLVIGGDGSWSATNSQNDNILYGSWQNNNILKSVNRGQTFSNADNGLSGAAAFIAPYVISESEPNILYSGRRKIFKTTNSGSNWIAVSSNLDGNNMFLSMSVSAQNPDYLVAATAPTSNRARLFGTTDGGTNWNDITQDLPDRYPMDLAIDPNNKTSVYAVFGGYGSGHVFKTLDFGNTWTDVTGTLPDVPTLSLAIDPLNSNYVYVGNDLGVYLSTDGGNVWSEYNDGLPEGILAMDLNISNSDRKLWVATHGNGAYKRQLTFSLDYFLKIGFGNIPISQLAGLPIDFNGIANNLGQFAQTQDYSIVGRLLDDSGSEIFNVTKTFCCLSPGETDIIHFNDNYILNSPGNYTFEIIKLGSTEFPGIDTLRKSITVFDAPSIAGSSVQKIWKTYSAITAGTSFSGDDIQRSTALPFNFIYDEFEYDKIQISTNGWVEFGTGANGTARGLSTSAQLGSIGANENGRLASTSRPNKALGPWWEDLNADGNGKVRYTVEGISPSRVFVIQWEDMRAYWDASTTTRVNFQVRLYEESYKIEYCYGPVSQGTFSGGDIGAMIGFKDHIGGDFHFYDIAAGGAIPEADVVTDLSPLTDWPGEDSAYVIQTIVTDIKDDVAALPNNFELNQNYPNPFNPTTQIRYNIPSNLKEGTVSVKLFVFNVLGQKVASLVNRKQTAGSYVVTFNSENINSSSSVLMAAGVYIYNLQISSSAGNIYSSSKKMVLLK